MATAVGVFESKDRVSQAIEALHQEGFTEEEVSIVARNQGGGDDFETGELGEGQQNKSQENGRQQQRGQDDMETGDLGAGGGENIADGAGWGAGIGAIGGLLAGVGALAIPGIGPIVAAGPLAAALSGAVAGGVAGGLIDLGIPEEEGQRFEQDVKEGNILCVVESQGEEAETARRVMQEHGAQEVQVYQ